MANPSDENSGGSNGDSASTDTLDDGTKTGPANEPVIWTSEEDTAVSAVTDSDTLARFQHMISAARGELLSATSAGLITPQSAIPEESENAVSARDSTESLSVQAPGAEPKPTAANNQEPSGSHKFGVTAVSVDHVDGKLKRLPTDKQPNDIDPPGFDDGRSDDEVKAFVEQLLRSVNPTKGVFATADDDLKDMPGTERIVAEIQHRVRGIRRGLDQEVADFLVWRAEQQNIDIDTPDGIPANGGGQPDSGPNIFGRSIPGTQSVDEKRRQLEDQVDTLFLRDDTDRDG